MNIKKGEAYIVIAIALIVVLAFVQPASACDVYVEGYVMYCGCTPARDLIVKLYRKPSFPKPEDEYLVGTNTTNSNGYYRIDFLLGWTGEIYKIELWSSDGHTLLNSTTILWENARPYRIDFKLPGVCRQGLTPGFWKNHLDAWVDYLPEDSLDDVFDNDDTGVPLDQYTLLEALRFKGGRGVNGAERILLRAAVAAILNAAHPDINYPLTTAEIIDAVNYALQSDDRAAILELAQQLDNYNNLGL